MSHREGLSKERVVWKDKTTTGCWAGLPDTDQPCNLYGDWEKTIGLCPTHYEEIVGESS